MKPLEMLKNFIRGLLFHAPTPPFLTLLRFYKTDSFQIAWPPLKYLKYPFQGPLIGFAERKHRKLEREKFPRFARCCKQLKDV